MQSLPSWKAIARDCLSSAHWPFFAARVRNAKSRWAKCLHIVTLHRVLPAEKLRAYPLPGLAVTPEELRELLTFFTRHFDCGTLFDVGSRFCAAASAQSRDTTQRARRRPLLALTFDDGTLDHFLHARPVLDEFGVRATFFVTTDCVKKPTPLWHDALGFAAHRALLQNASHVAQHLQRWGVPRQHDPIAQARAVVRSAKQEPRAVRERWIAELRALAGGETLPAWDGMMDCAQLATLLREGHEIGSHSNTHPRLPECTDTELATEITDSKTWLETQFGVRVASFCYPNGDFDARTLDRVAKSEYRFAVTTTPGSNTLPANLYTLHRFDLNTENLRDRHGAFSCARLAWRMRPRKHAPGTVARLPAAPPNAQ